MVSFKNFSYKYPKSNKFALQDINLTVKVGDFVGIIGPSGSGKTTLTYSINGVVPHHFKGDFYGEVNVNGMDTVTVTPEKLSKYVQSVFQDIDSQMVAAIVEDEILFGLENYGVPHSCIEERIVWALEQVGIADLRNREINTLSGGQKQKVAIAAIIALKPKIIVLDEPTGELDPESSYRIFALLKKLNEAFGITIIVVEQKIMLLCEFANMLAVMNNGKVEMFAETAQVLQNSKQLKNIGVNVPRYVTLYNLLNDKGLYSQNAPINTEQAVKMVREIVGND